MGRSQSKFFERTFAGIKYVGNIDPLTREFENFSLETIGGRRPEGHAAGEKHRFAPRNRTPTDFSFESRGSKS